MLCLGPESSITWKKQGWNETSLQEVCVYEVNATLNETNSNAYSND